MSFVQLFEIGFFEKVGFSKSAVWNYVFFLKAECLVKTVKKHFFEKTECLASTYKSGDLSCKLLKKTMYI